MKPVYVYIAGPLSGYMSVNTRRAILVGNELLDAGYIPYVPHLTSLWEMVAGQRSWESWLAYDECWLARCDILLRLPGESPGAEREVAFAREHGIPVVSSIDELKERFPLT